MLLRLGDALQHCALHRKKDPAPLPQQQDSTLRKAKASRFVRKQGSNLLLWRASEVFGQGVLLLTQSNSSTLMQPAYHLLLPGARLCVFVSPSPLSWLIHASSIIDGRCVSGGAWRADRVLAAATADAKLAFLWVAGIKEEALWHLR